MDNATHLGLDVQKETIAEAASPCDVIASTLIPRRAGRRVKTDRIDACNLARLHGRERVPSSPTRRPDTCWASRQKRPTSRHLTGISREIQGCLARR